MAMERERRNIYCCACEGLCVCFIKNSVGVSTLSLLKATDARMLDIAFAQMAWMPQFQRIVTCEGFLECVIH